MKYEMVEWDELNKSLHNKIETILRFTTQHIPIIKFNEKQTEKKVENRKRWIDAWVQVVWVQVFVDIYWREHSTYSEVNRVFEMELSPSSGHL